MSKDYLLVPKDVRQLINASLVGPDGDRRKGISIDMVKRLPTLPADHRHHLPAYELPCGTDGKRYFRFNQSDVAAWIARNRPEDD